MEVTSLSSRTLINVYETPRSFFPVAQQRKSGISHPSFEVSSPTKLDTHTTGKTPLNANRPVVSFHSQTNKRSISATYILRYQQTTTLFDQMMATIFGRNILLSFDLKFILCIEGSFSGFTVKLEHSADESP